MSTSTDYAAFSALSSALRARGLLCAYRWTGTEWEIGYATLPFWGIWETRTGRVLADVCAAVRREVGA